MQYAPPRHATSEERRASSGHAPPPETVTQAVSIPSPSPRGGPQCGIPSLPSWQQRPLVRNGRAQEYFEFYSHGPVSLSPPTMSPPAPGMDVLS